MTTRPHFRQQIATEQAAERFRSVTVPQRHSPHTGDETDAGCPILRALGEGWDTSTLNHPRFKSSFLSGHEFSRADKPNKVNGALAPAECLSRVPIAIPNPSPIYTTSFPSRGRKPHSTILSILFLCLAATGFAQAPTPSVVLDRVVAVVNNHAILASDVDDEIHLAILDPGRAGLGVLTPQRALEQLISRALIQQQIREEDAQAATPPQAEVDARLVEIRKEIPACVRENCASDSGWKVFLATHHLTPERVQTYLRYRIQILRFIEQRFRQGIRISQQEIETYYHETLSPQYAPGEAVPKFEAVAPRIEEILLQRQVNALFDDWLKKLRAQGEVEVLDPALESPEAPGGGEASK